MFNENEDSLQILETKDYANELILRRYDSGYRFYYKNTTNPLKTVDTWDKVLFFESVFVDLVDNHDDPVNKWKELSQFKPKIIFNFKGETRLYVNNLPEEYTVSSYSTDYYEKPYDAYIALKEHLQMQKQPKDLIGDFNSPYYIGCNFKNGYTNKWGGSHVNSKYTQKEKGMNYSAY